MFKRNILVFLLLGLSLALSGCKSDTKEPAATPDKPAKDAKPANGAASQPAGKTAKGPASAPASAPAKTGKNRVFFAFPQEDGAKIFATSRVVFGVEGMTISPAGQNAGDKTKGHHHLIINSKAIASGTAVPADEKHIHFGKGQTETEVKLPPGKHTLTMQFADATHTSYGPDMSATINVEVVPDPPSKKVMFLEPADNAKVKSPVKVKFGVEGMTVIPAGQDVPDKTKGHHHLIIDGKPIPTGKPVPADEKHIHYGKGQLETEVKLAPGKHTLTMQFADGSHLSYGPDMSTTITVEVTE